MKPLLFVLTALLACQCVMIKPVPVKLADLAGKDYVRAGSWLMQTGPYKRKVATLVQYDAVFRILVDDRGQPVEMNGSMDLLNYFSAQGWKYVEWQPVHLAEKVKVNFSLLERRK